MDGQSRIKFVQDAGYGQLELTLSLKWVGRRARQLHAGQYKSLLGTRMLLRNIINYEHRLIEQGRKYFNDLCVLAHIMSIVKNEIDIS